MNDQVLVQFLNMEKVNILPHKHCLSQFLGQPYKGVIYCLHFTGEENHVLAACVKVIELATITDVVKTPPCQ